MRWEITVPLEEIKEGFRIGKDYFVGIRVSAPKGIKIREYFSITEEAYCRITTYKENPELCPEKKVTFRPVTQSGLESV